MATTVSISGVKAGFSWILSKDNSFGFDTTNSGTFTHSQSYENGTGESKVNKFYATETTIAASGTLSLDLAGVLTDVFGATATFTKIRLIYIELVVTEASVSSSINVGGDTNAFSSFLGDASDVVKIRSGGCFQLSCKDATAYSVTASTGDILKIVNADSVESAYVRIGIAGE